MSRTLDEARAALRVSQGGGARYDAEKAPARELDWARRGTAYFARLLNNLTDAELDEPSDIEGLTRRHLVALAGYQARMLAELVAWVRQGREGRLPRPAKVGQHEIEWGMTLPSHALRHLVQHSAIHLDVEWRDLTDTDWDKSVVDQAGSELPVRETPQLRAQLLWSISTNLGAGGRLADVPAGIELVSIESLLGTSPRH